MTQKGFATTKNVFRAALACLAAMTLEGCATRPAMHSLNGDDIPYVLRKPDGNGPFPAIVLMHDCSGMGVQSGSGIEDRWAQELVGQGYVTLMPDSFSGRGFPQGVCKVQAKDRASLKNVPLLRAQDALTALAYLRTLPYVDGKHIGIMGGSHGGMSTVATIALQDQRVGPGNGFTSAVALYPVCEGSWWQGVEVRRTPRTGQGPFVYSHAKPFNPGAPMLILAGELDDWTPAGFCQELTKASEGSKYPIRITIYPGAHHAFDTGRPVARNQQFANTYSEGGWGATTGGNPAAWADAEVQVRDFFAKTLKTP